MTRSQKLYGKTALLLAGVAAAALLITLVTGVDRRPAEKTRIVASFYPVYIAALNLADGIEGVEVESLTGPTTGCLHDYQLSPDNRIALSSASVLAVNGAGAESFLADLLEETPDLPVIDTSEGIPLLESGMEHDHGGGAHDSHDGHDSHNEHIWTSPALYHKQVENLRDGLAAADPAHAEQYRENAAHYLKEIDAVGERLRRAAASLPYQDCIIFHDSLAYMAQDWGLTVAASLPIGEESAVAASDLAAAEEKAAEAGRVLLLYDAQYPQEYAFVGQAAEESRTITLDTAVTGESVKSAWLDAMETNCGRLEEAAGLS